MKCKMLVLALLLFAGPRLFSQAVPYNVVFDLTTDDTTVHQRVIRWITMIEKSNPDAKLEVVFYGKSLAMAEQEKSTVADAIKKLSANKNVAFRVCEVAMKAHKVEKSQLIAGVGTVPDGLYEIISKQAQGYGYIKVVQ
ncbi:MAG: hypothetical protein GC171_01705 [Terrimonas sp.]|nr:hypothetical protein [Terrimonas sp.]